MEEASTDVHDFLFGSPVSSEVVVCEHCRTTLPLTVNDTLNVALTAAHLNAEYFWWRQFSVGL